MKGKNDRIDEKISITPARTSDLRRLRAFFARVYRQTHIFTKARQLRWNFSNFANTRRSLSAVSAETASRRIVGFLGAASVYMRIGGTAHNAGWFANWITDKDFRGLGIGTKMLQKVSGFYTLPLAASFSDAAYPLYLKNGWEKIGRYRRFVAILDWKKTAELTALLYPSVRASLFQRNHVNLLHNNFNDNGITVRWNEPLKRKAWNQGWQAMRSRFGMTADRSWEYLSWRFFKHPFIAYKYAIACDPVGTIVGLLVLRIERARRFRIARIVDIVSRPDADTPLIQSAISFARKYGCVAIDAYLTYDEYHKRFAACGFRDARKHELHMIPELFNPFAERPQDPKKSIILAKLSPLIKRTDFPPAGTRHFVKADGDRDRA